MKLFENIELEDFSDFISEPKVKLDKKDKTIEDNFDTLEDLLIEPETLFDLKDLLNSKLKNKKFEFDLSNSDSNIITLQTKGGIEKNLTIEKELNRLNVYSIVYKNDVRLPIFTVEEKKTKELISFLNKFINKLGNK